MTMAGVPDPVEKPSVPRPAESEVMIDRQLSPVPDEHPQDGHIRVALEHLTYPITV